MHSKSQPCSSNQCDTARLESKLTRHFKMMFISSQIEHSFSNKAQRLVYRRQRCRTKRRLRDTRSVADSHLVHSSTLISPSFLHSSHNCQNNTILVPLTIFVITAHICTMMMQFDHDKFCRRLSNCQLHHTVQISVVSTTVLTMMTTHNTALGITVPSAPHFLCPARVSTHIYLPLMYITIDK